MAPPFATYLPTAGHAAALRRAHESPAGPVQVMGRDVDAHVAELQADRVAGTRWGLTLVEDRVPIGLGALAAVDGTEAGDVHLWVVPSRRRHGGGAFLLGKLLELAFQNLRLQRVCARPTDDRVRRLLIAAGFTAGVAASVAASVAAADDATLALARDGWIAHRDAPALGRLHPALRAILDAELAAGNAVIETGGGFPDTNSVFVRLRDRFRTRPDPLPDGVVYTEPNDPHWWFADYSSTAPCHVLAC